MSESEAVHRIRRTVQESGESLRSWAKRWGVSAAHLSDVLNGKRHIGPKLAAACGWRVHRVVSYELSYKQQEVAP